MAKLKLNPWFLGPYGLLLLLLTPCLFIFSKGHFLLWLNAHNSPLLDELFAFTNNMGEGLFYALVLVLLLLVRVSYCLYGLICLIITSIIVQTLKVLVDAPRPVVWLPQNLHLHFVDGVVINHRYSFPSGHTATAFTLFCFLSMIVANKRWGLLFLLMATFAGLARIYLVQHFFMDVYAGSVIGVLVSWGVYNWIEGHHWFAQHPRFRAPIYKLRSK